LNVTIVGAGISGLATGHALLSLRPELDVAILEAAERTGGKVWTDHTPEGYACEWGVNGFLDNRPRTLALAESLSLSAIPGFGDAARRYVYRNGTLHQLPESPPAFLKTHLMSPRGRLRVLWEPFVKRGPARDESLADFGRRRLGREAFEALIDPMASGVFAGDPEQMSLKSCFPRIHELEAEHGSLIRAMIRLQRRARREGKGKGPGPGPGGKLTSFAGGMSELTDRLTALLAHRVVTSAMVEGIDFEEDRYRVFLAGKPSLETDRLILAAPAHAQAEMLQDMAPDLALLLNGISYPPLSVVCLGYRERDLGEPPDGFGFLVPGPEKRDILGTIVDSNVFPDRAPPGSVLLRTMVGGSRAPRQAQLPDEQLADTVRAELKTILGVDAEPEFLKIYRHERAIPQYHVGHAERLRKIEKALERFPGLVLTGNAFHGVSLNDCVENAWRTAEKFQHRGDLV